VGRVFEQERVGVQRTIEEQRKGNQPIDTIYFQRNGYWYSLPRQVFASPTDKDIKEFRLPLERDFVPPNFLETLSPPLPSSLSSLSPEYSSPIPKVMGYSRGPPITFSGDESIGVRAFLSWMDSWFATMGQEFARGEGEVNRMRVAQIHVACPIRSAAGRFLRQLPDDILWDEKKLREVLIEQFDDLDGEDQAQEDILTIMSGLEQGERDVFVYSRKVLKVLQRKPAKANHYDRILIRYYIEGLSSQRLREMAFMNFQKPDSKETPYKVVRGVMRLAAQWKMKGYRKEDDDLKSSDEDEDSGDDDTDSYWDSDDERGCGQSKKSERRSRKGKKRSEKRRQSKTGKRNGRHEEDSVREEMRELRGMFRDLVKSQQAAPSNSGTLLSRPDAEIIPLDSYAVNRTYGNYAPAPPPLTQPRDRFEYERSNHTFPAHRRPDFPNRRSQMRHLIHPVTDRGTSRVFFATGGNQESGRAGPATYESLQTSYQTPRVTDPSMQPIVGPNGMLYYPSRNSLVCYHCGEEGHMRPHCRRLTTYGPPLSLPGAQEPVRSDPPRSSTVILPPPPPPPAARDSERAVSVVEVVGASSAFDGVKVREVSTAEVDEKLLMKFVKKVSEDEEEEGESDSDLGAPVMAGERARRFSELPEEFDGEAGPASQRPRTEYGQGVDPEGRSIKQPVSRAKRKPTRMMAGREKFDFVGAFRDAPVLGLNWGSFFDLAPSVKKDICRLLVQERAKDPERGKSKKRGKRVSVDAGTQNSPEEEPVLLVATDRSLGDISNFYTQGIITTTAGKYSIRRILVDAGSVVNLMPIKVLKAVGATLNKTSGMVIRTATNALARIAYYADLRVTVAGVPCDLRVYALPSEYSPTYPMLLSRRWLQAVKAKGDYAGGRYFIMSGHGTRVQIPSDRTSKDMVRATERGRPPRVPIVLRDKEAGRNQLSVEIENELKLQESHGSRFFERLIELIRKEADQQMRDEDEDDDDEAYYGGVSEDSEN